MHDQNPTPPRLFRVTFDVLVGHGVTATTPQVTQITDDLPAEGTYPLASAYAHLAGHALTDGRYDSETDPTGRYTTLATHEVLRGLLDAMDTDDTDSDTPDTP